MTLTSATEFCIGLIIVVPPCGSCPLTPSSKSRSRRCAARPGDKNRDRLHNA